MKAAFYRAVALVLLLCIGLPLCAQDIGAFGGLNLSVNKLRISASDVRSGLDPQQDLDAFGGLKFNVDKLLTEAPEPKPDVILVPAPGPKKDSGSGTLAAAIILLSVGLVSSAIGIPLWIIGGVDESMFDDFFWSGMGLTLGGATAMLVSIPLW
jgi:hypothetical protein